MKKSLITAACICAALISSASSVNWTINTQSWTLQNGEYAPKGTTVWFYDYTYINSLTAALKNKAVVDFSSSNWKESISGLTGIYATDTTDNDRGLLSEVTVTHPNLIDYSVNDDEYDLGTLFIDTTSSTDKIYYCFANPSESVYATDDLSSLDIATMTIGRYLNSDRWQVAQSVPEPTSGLLLLLGFAGLTLRRRKA